MTLLLAVGSNANGQNIILAWAVVESENSDSWGWFLRHLKWDIPEVTTEDTTVLSDRDKGLVEAVRSLGPRVFAAHCCKHLKDNFQERFKRYLIPYFWKVAKAKIALAYQDSLQALREVPDQGLAAATYLEAAEPETRATALCRGRRYGHETSNCVESVNKVICHERELPIVELLDAVWQKGEDGPDQIGSKSPLLHRPESSKAMDGSGSSIWR